MALAPLLMTSIAPSAPSGGSDLLSNWTTSIGCPSPRPAALMWSTASLAPAMVSASIGWNHPLNDITRPKTGLSAAAAADAAMSARPRPMRPCIRVFITPILRRDSLVEPEQAPSPSVAFPDRSKRPFPAEFNREAQSSRFAAHAHSIDLRRYVPIEPAGINFGQGDGVDQEPCVAVLRRSKYVLAAALLDHEA